MHSGMTAKDGKGGYARKRKFIWNIQFSFFYFQAQKGSNTVAIGYDEGTVVLKLGREEPAVRKVEISGKVITFHRKNI